MKNHWVVFDDKNDKEAEVKVFHQYRAELQNYLEKVTPNKYRISDREHLIFNGKHSANC